MFKQDKMKKIFRTLCVLCVTSFALTSCLGDDDNSNTETYGDVAVTQFTLGTLNRYTSSVSSKTGNDTIIKSTLTGTNYPMTIDQLGCQIYNQKVLPVGTDVKHVPLSSVTAKNSGIVVIKSMTSDSLKTFSTKDSIDFSSPRTLRVYSTNGQSYRDYTVTLNVSETEGSTFEWTKVADNIPVDNFTDKYLVAYQDSVLLVDKAIIPINNVYGGPNFMRLGAEGYVERTYGYNDPTVEDNWFAVIHDSGVKPNLKRLIGGSTEHEIFAIGNDNRLKVSLDGIGLKWYDESLDDAETLLPVENIACVSWPYAAADDTDYILMAGNSQTDDQATVVWRKISQYANQTVWQNWGQWVYMPVDDNNTFVLERQENLSMVYYEGSVLAVGSLLKIYESRDQGITWYTDNDYTLPENLEGTQLSMAVANDGRLWLVTDSGQLWMGTGK